MQENKAKSIGFASKKRLYFLVLYAMMSISNKGGFFMFCKNCGQALADGALFCPNCNAPVQAAQPQTPPVNPYDNQQQAPYGAPQQPYGYAPQQPPYGAQQPYGYPPQQPYGVPPEKPALTWLIVNIVCLVLSGSIFSIIGTIFGALAQSAYNKGAYAEAESKSKTTKILGIVSIVSLVLVYICVFFFFFLGAAAMDSGYYY